MGHRRAAKVGLTGIGKFIVLPSFPSPELILGSCGYGRGEELSRGRILRLIQISFDVRRLYGGRAYLV
jgi:hypothetical protein